MIRRLIETKPIFFGIINLVGVKLSMNDKKVEFFIKLGRFTIVI